MKPSLLVCLFVVGALAQTRPSAEAWYAGTSHDPAMLEVILDKLRAARNFSDSPRDSEGFARDSEGFARDSEGFA